MRHSETNKPRGVRQSPTKKDELFSSYYGWWWGTGRLNSESGVEATDAGSPFNDKVVSDTTSVDC